MPQTNTTLDRLTRILCDLRAVLPDQVTPDARIAGDLCGDSLDEVEVVIGVEEEFGIEIPDAEAESIVTVADYVALIDRLVAK